MGVRSNDNVLVNRRLMLLICIIGKELRVYGLQCWCVEEDRVSEDRLNEIARLNHRWGWLLFPGIAMLALGVAALILIPAATLGTVLALSWLLVVSGVMEAISAFQVRSWGGFFLHLVGGIVGVLVGLLVVSHPAAGRCCWPRFSPSSAFSGWWQRSV